MSDNSPQEVVPIEPRPTWVPVNPFPARVRQGSFVSGSDAAERTRVAYYREPDSDHLFACVRFGPASEGPPDAVHGGAIAAVLDEAMGGSCWMNGHAVVGARITINYVHMVPLGFEGHVEAWITHIERRKCFITSRLMDSEGKIYAEGEALFIKLRHHPLNADQAEPAGA